MISVTEIYLNPIARLSIESAFEYRPPLKKQTQLASNKIEEPDSSDQEMPNPDENDEETVEEDTAVATDLDRPKTPSSISSRGESRFHLIWSQQGSPDNNGQERSNSNARLKSVHLWAYICS